MRKTSIILLLCAFFISLQNSYGKELTIADLCKGTYSAKRISGVNPLNDGETYSQLSADRKQIVKYSFKNGKQLEVIFDVATARNVSLKGIDGYIMSPDEKNILIQTETKAIYRRSFTAVYYLYNIANSL